MPVVQAIDVGRTFATPAGDVVACSGVTFDVHPGELVVVGGPSGSGKTTLLNLLGGLDIATRGSVRLDGVDLGDLSEQSRLTVRRDTVGYVFQSFGLIPVLTAAENVEVPLRIRRTPAEERDRRTREALASVGLLEHHAQRPDELSGGQQQRVAIARALIVEPRLLIADEPTGQLDSRTGAAVMDLIVELVRERQVAAVVATHDQALVDRADRIIMLRNGVQTSSWPSSV